MSISKNKSLPTCNVYINGEPIKQVDRFNYLGSTITSDGRCDEDIKKRIALSKQAFQKMSPVLKNRAISINTNIIGVSPEPYLDLISNPFNALEWHHLSLGKILLF
jgi:hypothetical protein